MNCPKCGSGLDENAKFCGNCGAPVQMSAQSSVDSSINNVDNSMGSTNDMSSSDNKSSSNLKNALIILLVCLLVGGLAIVGCKFLLGTKSSADKIEYALNNMLDMSGFKLNVNFDLSSNSNGEQVAVNMGANSVIDINNKLASINVSASTMGITFDIPAYIDMNSNIFYLKVPTDNNWYNMDFSQYVGELEALDMDNRKFVIEDYLKNNDFIEKVDSDLTGADKYVLHFTKDVLTKLSDDNTNSFDYSMLEEYGFDSGFDVSLYINKKENYITRFVFDFSGKSFDDITFDKFVFSIDITDVDNIEKIVIPSEALSSEALDLSDFSEGLYEDESDDYVDDYKLTYQNHVIDYKLPEGSVASSVNSSNFKIYRKDGMRVLMSIDYDTRDSFFEYVDSEKEGIAELGYTDIALSDMKQLSYDGKTFYYKELTYTTSYGTNEKEVYMCYTIDDEYVYSITFEDDDNNGSVTEDSIKSFLNFTAK